MSVAILANAPTLRPAPAARREASPDPLDEQPVMGILAAAEMVEARLSVPARRNSQERLKRRRIPETSLEVRQAPDLCGIFVPKCTEPVRALPTERIPEEVRHRLSSAIEDVLPRRSNDLEVSPGGEHQRG